jgi:excisionase family DNA binding protein
VTDKYLFTVREAAKLLGLSRTKVYELIRSGDLESFHIGRSRRIARQALDRFVAKLDNAVDGPHDART